MEPTLFNLACLVLVSIYWGLSGIALKTTFDALQSSLIPILLWRRFLNKKATLVRLQGDSESAKFDPNESKIAIKVLTTTLSLLVSLLLLFCEDPICFCRSSCICHSSRRCIGHSRRCRRRHRRCRCCRCRRRWHLQNRLSFGCLFPILSDQRNIFFSKNSN